MWRDRARLDTVKRHGPIIDHDPDVNGIRAGIVPGREVDVRRASEQLELYIGGERCEVRRPERSVRWDMVGRKRTCLSECRQVERSEDIQHYHFMGRVNI